MTPVKPSLQYKTGDSLSSISIGNISVMINCRIVMCVYEVFSTDTDTGL